MWCSTASTTTIASSTTRPIASTRPNSDNVLIEKPSSGKSAKAPISETGTVSSGIRVARQLCRKMNTTRTTSTTPRPACARSPGCPRSPAAWCRARPAYSRPGGKRFLSSARVLLDLLATSSALEPGDWKAATTAAGLPLKRADLPVVRARRARSRATSLEPHDASRRDSARTTIAPNSSGVDQAPLGAHGVVNCCPVGAARRRSARRGSPRSAAASRSGRRRHGEPEARQHVRLHPDAHGVVGGAEVDARRPRP